MYFRDFMQRELFVIKSSQHTHTKIFDLLKREPPKKMEDNFHNTELKNKIKKSERGKKKNLTTVKTKSSILRKRNTAEHRWGWCPFCVVCLSVRNSFRIAAVRAGAAGAAAPGLGGAAAAEPGRASRGSRAGFLCGEEGSDVVTCEELNYGRFATSFHPLWLLSQLRFAWAGYLPAAFACSNEAHPVSGCQGSSGCRWPWKFLIHTGVRSSCVHSPACSSATSESRKTPPDLCKAASSLVCTERTFCIIFHTTALHGLGFFNPTTGKTHPLAALHCWSVCRVLRRQSSSLRRMNYLQDTSHLQPRRPSTWTGTKAAPTEQLSAQQ